MTTRRVRYGIGVRDSDAEVPRLLTRDDWRRTVRGDRAVTLTRQVGEAKLWRTETEMWLAFAEFNLGTRGLSGIRVELPPRGSSG